MRGDVDAMARQSAVNGGGDGGILVWSCVADPVAMWWPQDGAAAPSTASSSRSRTPTSTRRHVASLSPRSWVKERLDASLLSPSAHEQQRALRSGKSTWSATPPVFGGLQRETQRCI